MNLNLNTPGSNGSTMKKLNPPTMLLVCGVFVAGLAGCERLEQAATDAVDNAKQSAVQALDEIRQANSIEEAKQSAHEALQSTRQKAAGLLDEASGYLAGEQPPQGDGQAPAEAPPAGS